MKTAALLTETLGFSPLQSEGNRRRYGVEEGNGGAVLDIVEEPTAKPGNSGAGTVHHIAFRVDDDAAQEWRRKQLVEAGYPVSPVMDRTYFHSIYFREPGGVLFASNPHGDNSEGWNRGRYGAYHDLESWRRFLSAAAFGELTHYYRPPGLPRDRQPWLASVWRK